jgi:3',5'-cyclic AMP phosphodiesterase CpdA
MIRLFHISDIHFGAEDRVAIDWFQLCARDERPDAVIVTGDLTMRARLNEFSAAAEWLSALACPVTVEVGNHDLPHFNPFARLFTPYRRYRALEEMIERPLNVRGVAVVPLKTTARFQWRLNWSKGYVSARAMTETLSLVKAVPEGHVILVAAHHPLVGSGTLMDARTRHGTKTLAALAKAGVHAVLTGHVHDPFDLPHEVEGRTVRLIGAGTLSERVRAAPPSFNEIRIADAGITVIARKRAEPDAVMIPKDALRSY